MDKDIFNSAVILLKNEINFDIDRYFEIDKGANNKLFRLESFKGHKLLLKIYRTDERNRLQREFSAFQYLNKKHFLHIPTAYIKNDELQYGVYSFEEGHTKLNKDITIKDITVMAEFLAKLHSIQKDNSNTEFIPAVLSCFSLQDYINNINFRLKKYIDYISSDSLHVKVKQLNEQFQITEILTSLITETIKNLTNEEVITPLSNDQQRLSPVDFGPHNMLFTQTDDIVFIDFEYFGWDDPVREIADFVNHDQTKNISEEKKKIFIDTYLKRIHASDIFTKRLQIVIRLVAIEWITIHLYAMTPEKTRTRNFAINNFDVEMYLDEQIAKFHERVDALINH